jgi:hypothetical protein
MKQLIETIEELRLRNIGFRSLTESLDTTIPQGRLVFHISRLQNSVSAVNFCDLRRAGCLGLRSAPA